MHWAIEHGADLLDSEASNLASSTGGLQSSEKKRTWDYILNFSLVREIDNVQDRAPVLMRLLAAVTGFMSPDRLHELGFVPSLPLHGRRHQDRLGDVKRGKPDVKAAARDVLTGINKPRYSSHLTKATKAGSGNNTVNVIFVGDILAL